MAMTYDKQEIDNSKSNELKIDCDQTTGVAVADDSGMTISNKIGRKNGISSVRRTAIITEVIGP